MAYLSSSEREGDAHYSYIANKRLPSKVPHRKWGVSDCCSGCGSPSFSRFGLFIFISPQFPLSPHNKFHILLWQFFFLWYINNYSFFNYFFVTFTFLWLFYENLVFFFSLFPDIFFQLVNFPFTKNSSGFAGFQFVIGQFRFLYYYTSVLLTPYHLVCFKCAGIDWEVLGIYLLVFVTSRIFQIHFCKCSLNNTKTGRWIAFPINSS